jgi:predicted aspartyl protease
METFRVEFEIGDSAGQRWKKVEGLVDMGSTYTWVPREVLVRLGVQPQFTREFETADGRIIERDVAVATARLDGQALPTLVVFSDGGSPLLGVVTLEEFGFGVDPVNQRLVRVRGLATTTSHQ